MKDRRRLIRAIGVSGGAFVVSSLPSRWSRPVIETVVLPSHAQTTNPAGSTPPPPSPSNDGTGLSIAGELEFRLVWTFNSVDGGPDLDIHVIDPGSTEWFWFNAAYNTNPNLDIDDVGEPSGSGGGPERMYWETAPSGTFQYFVQWFRNQSTATMANWTVFVYANGSLVSTRVGSFTSPPDETNSSVFTITV